MAMEILFAWDEGAENLVEVSQDNVKAEQKKQIKPIDLSDFHHQQALIRKVLQSPEIYQQHPDHHITLGFVIRKRDQHQLSELNHLFNQAVPSHITMFNPFPFQEENMESIANVEPPIPFVSLQADVLWVGRVRDIA